MSLTGKDIEKLDWQSEYGATLETHELLEVLGKIAEDPQAYTWAEFDAGYTRAEQLANALRGMMGGLRAAEIAKTFKGAVKARAACEKYDLVPRATLEHAQEQLRAAAAMNIAIEARITAMAPKPAPIGASETNNWTGEKLWGALRDTHKNEYSPWGGISETTTEIMERLAVILNGKPVSIGPGDPLPPPPPQTSAWALRHHDLA